MEIYELAAEDDHRLQAEVRNHLEALRQRRPEIAHLITDGLEMAKQPVASS